VRSAKVSPGDVIHNCKSPVNDQDPEQVAISSSPLPPSVSGFGIVNRLREIRVKMKRALTLDDGDVYNVIPNRINGEYGARNGEMYAGKPLANDPAMLWDRASVAETARRTLVS